MRNLAGLFLLGTVFVTNSAFAECDTLPPYWCNDGSYAKNLMDAIQQNTLEDGMARTQQQQQLAEKKRQLEIQANLKWLTESEGRKYVAVSSLDAMKSCILKTLLGAMFSNKPPARGGQADSDCQQGARYGIDAGHYESLAFYRKENKIKPPRKGTDTPGSQESIAALAYRNKRFEDDLKMLSAESQVALKEVSSSTETNSKLCAEQGDALACHEMITKPFAAAFKEVFGRTKKGGMHASMVTPAVSSPVIAAKPALPPMPKDLKLPENGEYDPYAIRKWSCKVGFVQVEDRCQKQ